MMFKNSIKLLMANFSTVWKLLVYKIIALGIVAGLFFAVFPALQNLPSFSVFISDLGNFLLEFNIGANIKTILTSFYEIFQNFFVLYVDLAVNSTFAFVYLTALFGIVLPYLWKLSDIATGESLYGYMASLTRYSFTGSFIRKIGISSIYSLLYLAITLPINLIIVAGAFGILSLVQIGGIVVLFIPLLLFVYLSCIIGLKNAFLAGWMPAIVVFNTNAVKGFKLGLKAVQRRFLRVLSTSAMLVAIIFAINLLFGSFSLIITVPVGSMIISVFQMVMFFGSQGMRYYVDLDTILSPKKLEETDKLKKVKNLI